MFLKSEKTAFTTSLHSLLKMEGILRDRSMASRVACGFFAGRLASVVVPAVVVMRSNVYRSKKQCIKQAHANSRVRCGPCLTVFMFISYSTPGSSP